jgi:hypothetical protein
VKKRVEYARKIQKRLKAKEEEMKEKEIRDMEGKWRIFKETINTVAEKVCVWTMMDNKKKHT